MSVEEKPLIFVVLLQLLLLFPGTRVHAQNSNELGSSNGIPCPRECLCTTGPVPSSTSVEEQSVPIPFPIVTCSSRNITSIPDGISPSVKKLDLSHNNISWIDPDKLSHLTNLHQLSLMSNLLQEINASAFSSLSSLKELTLSGNQLTLFPTQAIPANLELLNLEHNRITRLEDHILPPNSKIHALLLGHNLIEKIDDLAFDGLLSLQLLELEGNRLTEVPKALEKLPQLQELSLANNRISRIDIPFHQIIPRATTLTYLQMRGNPLQSVHPEAFSHLQHLKKLILSDVKNLTELPDLNGTTSLEILRIDRCSIYAVPSNLCSFVPKLKNLDLKSNKLRELPFVEYCSELRIIDLSMNDITDLREEAFINLSDLHDLHLHHNRVNKLTPATFTGLSNLRNLDLSYNAISEIHQETFFATPKLEDLNLGNNFFPDMPSKGLTHVVDLKTFNNPNLKEFPGPESFPKVRRLILSYAYHCCQFVAAGSAPTYSKSFFDQSPFEESVLYPTDLGFKNALSELNLTESWPGIVNLSNKAELGPDFWETFGTGLVPESPYMEEGSGDESTMKFRPLNPNDISCIPLPGPFLPCNDLFDWWTLRCGVWIVFLLALMGNGTVVFVQIFARSKMDVPRFLVCNLAIADFFMGIYLGFLAVIDAATLGEFRKFAISWQLSSACQVAGFLGVLSSELSVFTLTVITLERHYVITHAMHLNKRLSLKHASYIMVIGWIFALLMAILPLFGVSDYRKFAVCLPFETGDGVSLGYVVFLMFANGVAFTILMSCYVKMYCSIRGSAAWNSNETRIAKNMALLVFTDLLCWFPIAFFSLTAAFGLQLVSLEEAKVFTVFVLPLNSCCNPFLYAILTKQFKKDCQICCKAIEESRVTRGIGRCRHSSNFSNRQTAPNTAGSLTDKGSKDGQPCICHSGLHPGGNDVNGNAKYRLIPAPERLSRFGPFGRFFSRYILCQSNSKESNRQREDPRMQNVRRYLYNTATANYPADGQKHQRHPSVSSDNFSSSRSDSWRVQNRCGIPLRLLEPRRRNSWAVTRKPSQDSNLSSSRNDSSATSNSTATWRLSRSSVSSDATSHSGGGKSSFKKISTSTNVPTTSGASGGNHITTTASVNRSKNLPTSAASAAAVIASGSSGTMLPPNLVMGSGSSSVNPAVNPDEEVMMMMTNRPNAYVQSQFQQASNSGGSSGGGVMGIMQRRGSNPKTVTLTEPISMKRKNKGKKKKTPAGGGGRVVKRKSVRVKKPDADVIIIDDDEASAKIATNRPRLVRQSAFFSEEVVIEPEICPVHGPLNPGTYDDEDDEEDEMSDIDDIEEEEEDEEDGENESGEGEVESDGENSSPTDPILRKPSGQQNQQIGIALVIVPRRLSTISSRDTLSVRSRDENDQLNDIGGVNSNNNLNPSSLSSSPVQSGSGGFTQNNSSNSPTTALLLPAGFGRRKMSEQPVQFFVVPASSGLLNSAKWHSMSSVELSTNQSNNQPTHHQIQQAFRTSPSQSIARSSRSQSPRSFRANIIRHDGQRMTSMAENQEESSLLLIDSHSEVGHPSPSPPSNSSNSANTSTAACSASCTAAAAGRNFGYRDPNERRVSFQLPAVTVAMSGDNKEPNNTNLDDESHSAS